MEPTLNQLWYFILELRRDLTRLEIDLLQPQGVPTDSAQRLDKLHRELALLNDKLVKIQLPSV